jgi:hypothetical protein
MNVLRLAFRVCRFQMTTCTMEFGLTRVIEKTDGLETVKRKT